MKKCNRCLASSADDAVFCENCGAKLTQAGAEQPDSAQLEEIIVEAEPVVEEAAAPVSEPTFEPASEPEPAPEPSPAQQQQAYAYAAASNQQAAATGIPNPEPKQPAGVEKGASCEGILSMAWHDVHASKGWFGKVALLSLINLVPILNFVVYGYCLRWGRLASFKNASNEPLPPVFITGDYFKMGFFTAVVLLFWSAVSSLVCAIPIVGFVGFVATVFASPFICMCLQRMNLLNSFVDAFSFKNIWEKYRRNIGGALALAWLPALLVLAVVLAIAFGMMIVFGISAYGLVSGFYLMRALGLIGMIAVIIAAYIIFMAAVVASLVIFRAFGYWTVRNAPEWIDETYIAAGMTPPGR